MKTAFETPRLRMVAVDLERDIEHLFRFNSNPEAMRFIRPPVTSPEPLFERLAPLAGYRKRQPELGIWLVFLKETGQCIGNCIGRHTDWDAEKGELEIGYGFLPPFWGRGLASELVGPLAAFLFEKSHAPRLVAFTVAENVASEKALSKNGFRLDGPTDERGETLNRFLLDRPEKVAVRRARLGDLETVAPLFDGYRKFYGQPSDLDRAKTFLKERLEKRESVIFMAFLGEKAVGFTQLFPIFSSVSTERSWLLNDLFTAPEARRKGVGEALLRSSQAFVDAKKHKGLLLETAADNLAGQRLYEKLGWRKESDDYFFYFWKA